MKGIIKENGREFKYENLNSIVIRNGELIINYQDENDEECEEIGDIPEFLEIVGNVREKENVKKEYRVYNCGSEGQSTGTIFLTEAEAELINRVSNKENWDIITDYDSYDGCTIVYLVEEE